jgi:DNA-binding CsgD family transcriptional regulator
LCKGLNQKVDLNDVITRGVGDKFLEQFRQYYYKLDPFYKQIFPSNTSVVTNEQIVSFKDLVRSEYYNDFLKHQSLHFEMVIYLKSGDRRSGVVALFRPKNAANFSPEERVKAELLVPYLAGALEKTAVLEQINKSEKIVQSVTSDLSNKGIIILDENLEMTYQNEEAIKILPPLCQGGGDKEKTLDRLPQQLSLRCQELKKSISLKEPVNTYGEQYNQLISVKEQQVLIRMQLLNGGENSPFFLIYLEPNKPLFSSSQFMNKIGLTRREAEVVNLLSLGLRNFEISSKLFISEYTVENHLKSIYQKMGVKNRTSLIHRLTHLNWPEPAGTNGN